MTLINGRISHDTLTSMLAGHDQFRSTSNIINAQVALGVCDPV